jgi:hypothetical protein
MRAISLKDVPAVPSPLELIQSPATRRVFLDQRMAPAPWPNRWFKKGRGVMVDCITDV